MSDELPVFLVGPMGSGKSAVGTKLARLMGREFVDTDQEIEKRCGVDIAFIFEKEGEAGFRKREHEMLKQTAGQPGLVIATGGGIVTQKDNLAIFREQGIVVYLETSVEQQHRRTRHNSTRPLLNGDNPRRKLQELMDIRGPIYASIASITVNTDGQRVPQVARNIFEQLENFDSKKKP